MPTRPGMLRSATTSIAPFLAVLMTAGIGMLLPLAHDGHVTDPSLRAPHSAPTALATATRNLVARKRTVHVPAKPSQFALEQAMTASQLMNRWSALIAQASLRFKVPQPWIRAVLAAESGGRTLSAEGHRLTSSAGALGLMQLMPQTYDDMREQYGFGADPQDPHDNVFAGAAYLRALYLHYGYPAMFSAYNDGPGNLENRLRDGGLLPEETRLYAGGITHVLETGIGLHGVRVKFTRPDGTKIWIDSAAVVSVRAALRSEYAPGVLSVITVGRIRQGVCESVARAKAILRLGGGRV